MKMASTLLTQRFKNIKAHRSKGHQLDPKMLVCKYRSLGIQKLLQNIERVQKEFKDLVSF